MLKVLWAGDAIVNSGFSIVTHNICNELVTKCNLSVFGIGYDGSIKNQYPYYIFPGRTGKDLYSFSSLLKVIKTEKPDVIVVFNDDHIVERYIANLGSLDTRIVIMFPINLLPLDVDRMLAFSNASYHIFEVITYTNFSKNKIEEINPNLKVSAVYHGVNHDVFTKVTDAKKILGLDGIFVVGNINTNTYRKRLDLFLEGFAKFANGKNDVRCLVHYTNKDIAYDLPTICSDLNIKDKIIFSNSILDVTKMNMLYSVMDVNCLTSLGEGFGLSLIEGAACSVPILCPDHGNLRDIWTRGAELIKIKKYEYVAGSKTVGGVIDTDDFANKLEHFYTDPNYAHDVGAEALNRSYDNMFSWKVIANKIYAILVKANSGKMFFIS